MSSTFSTSKKGTTQGSRHCSVDLGSGIGRAELATEEETEILDPSTGRRKSVPATAPEGGRRRNGMAATSVATPEKANN